MQNVLFRGKWLCDREVECHFRGPRKPWFSGRWSGWMSWARKGGGCWSVVRIQSLLPKTHSHQDEYQTTVQKAPSDSEPPPALHSLLLVLPTPLPLQRIREPPCP